MLDIAVKSATVSPQETSVALVFVAAANAFWMPKKTENPAKNKKKGNIFFICIVPILPEKRECSHVVCYNDAMTQKIITLFVVALFFAQAFPVHAQTADTQAPSVPSNVSGTVIVPSQVSVSWSVSTDNVGVEAYYVYRNGQFITSINATTFVDTNLSPGVYSYTVAAYDAAGNVSQQSLPANVALVQDVTSPSAPTGLSVNPTSTYASTSSIQVTLSWSASTDNVGVAGYYVYRDGAKITTSTAPLIATSYVDTLPPGMWTYSYKVAAYDASGNLSAYSSSTAFAVMSDTVPPTAPTQLTAKQTSLSGITLAWTASTDNIGVTGYDVYRNGQLLGTSASTSYFDTSLMAGALTTYTVAAYDAAGNVSPWSASVALMATSDNVPPSPPSGVSAIAGSSSIEVSWNPSADAVAIANYVVFKNDSQIATIASTSYIDTTPAMGSNIYRVIATNAGGISSASSAAANVNWYPAASTTAVASVPVTAVPNAVGSPAFTAAMYYGLRGDQVSALQSFLVAHGYLSLSVTGFF
jgi:fibronectin type 3 domain-containing protein